jgi:demethylmenaquinone methyltransferase/2-methoxy-6-polyprenyl-1,4-benzoquinol methylase
MFGTIAARYDLLNHLLSGNTDKRWRRLVAKALSASLSDPNACVLDVGCGTGDLTLTLLRAGHARIVGIDFCRPMLAIAATKAALVAHPSVELARFVFRDDETLGTYRMALTS